MRRVLTLAMALWILTFIAAFCITRSVKESEIPDTSVNTSENSIKNDGLTETIIHDSDINIRVYDAGSVTETTLDAYLPGVLASEMPSNFPEEALKAQVVAARSFILYRMAHPPADGVHPDADICNDPSHCKAYTEVGDDTYNIDKIRHAVSCTDGLALIYEGEAALAAFHAISGGKTENAEDVWGSYVPYLVSVESPGEEEALKYRATVEMDIELYRECLLKVCPNAVLEGYCGDWITDIIRSSAGGIINAKVGGIETRGTALRMALGLNSTDFYIACGYSSISIRTTGHGHGVGMSQYGAKAMADAGADFIEILEHYYKGCNITNLSEIRY